MCGKGHCNIQKWPFRIQKHGQMMGSGEWSVPALGRSMNGRSWLILLFLRAGGNVRSRCLCVIGGSASTRDARRRQDETLLSTITGSAKAVGILRMILFCPLTGRGPFV
ncbi:protein of unknown function [Acidithiobacillus ferrivorans]|uniref:Uncharacterized protein n=1 Tax=Acidithiobacillus ferrivorans TaxID=160808 RepID=A0ABY1MU19_9PROT|nr:protein of unknown function [Acidithiobacillus ferrivorans]